jgi:hypothetical protein
MNSALKKNKLDTIYQPNRKPFSTPECITKNKTTKKINIKTLKRKKPHGQLHFDDILYCHEDWDKIEEKTKKRQKVKKQLYFGDILRCHEDWDEIEEKVKKHQKNTKEDYYMENLLESLSTKHTNIIIRNPYFHTSRG